MNEQPVSGGITRRRLLAGGAGLMAAAVVVGCDASTEPTEPGPGSTADGPGPVEAPSLTAMVDAGELPPLAERLPGAPLVVETVEGPGIYGGTWRTAMVGPTDTNWMIKTIGYEYTVRWSPDFSEVIPNVVESFEVVDEGRGYVLHLRPGLKWSDGQPYNADDIVFMYEDVLRNADLHPGGISDWMRPAGEEPALEKVDEYTVRFFYETEPNGLFMQRLANTLHGAIFTTWPRHYLQDFHPAYNPDTEQHATDAGFDDWMTYFFDRANHWTNPEKPRMDPWLIENALGEGTRVTAVRNPYYFKTDPDGRQLPYIDQVTFDIVDTSEVMVLKATNGELDMHVRHINTVANKPVIAGGRETGDFDFFATVPSFMNEMIIALNLTHTDQVKREIFNNLDFRVGLSHAINRQEMIQAVFQQQGEPWQGAPQATTDFFNEQLAKQYTEYDVDLANQYLDQAGYDERDGDGFRLGPGGERISFSVEVATPALKDSWPDAMELVRGYWEAVGVEIDVTAEDRSLFNQRIQANQPDAVVWQGDGGLQDAIMEPGWYMPFAWATSPYANAWVDWFVSNGESEEGEEPPPATRQQMELYRELLTTADPDQQKELFRQILGIAQEQFYVIGTVAITEGYGIVSNKFHNVPGTMPDAFWYPTPAPTNPEQYYVQ